jgi:preprotein translocase subunit SecY
VEHDALAERLAARSSIDLVRRGALTGFAGLIVGGLAVKLGFDRWFSTRPTRFVGPPVLFFSALALALVLVFFATCYLMHARRRMQVEDAQFARMQELRSRLELDP